MRHVYECPVRFDDLDSYGHVNNVMMAGYLQEARIDFAHRYLIDDHAPHEGAVVAHQVIDYLAPVPFRTEPLRVEVWVTRIGGSSYDVSYQVRDGAITFARAATVLVAYDVAAGRARPLTPGERTTLEGFVEP